MFGKIDIKKTGRLLITITAALFLLSACSESTTRPVTRDEAVQASQAYNQYQVENDGVCWQAEVLKPVYDTIGAIVMKMYNQLSTGALSLMMMGFAVWLAIRLLKFISSVTEDNPGEVWNEIVRKAFICMFCGILASSSGMLLYVINTLLFPIYGAFLEFGSQILAMSTQDVTSVKVMGEEIMFTKPNVVCELGGSLNATLDGFPKEIEGMMSCMVCGVADRLQLGRTIALIVTSMGELLPVVIGLLIWSIFMVVSCGFVFYLVDSIFRFGMMILLLPIFIMAYAFGPTRKWTNVGFSNIMNSAAFMMAFSIIVATVLMAMISLINENPEIFDPAAPEIYMSQFSIAVMCLLLIAFLVFGSMQMAQQLTSSIIGGKVDAKFQQNLKATAQALLGIITGGVGWALKKSGFYEKTAMGRALKSGGALNNRLKKWAGREGR